jgi:elongation factor 1 alpha-like protein
MTTAIAGPSVAAGSPVKPLSKLAQKMAAARAAKAEAAAQLVTPDPTAGMIEGVVSLDIGGDTPTQDMNPVGESLLSYLFAAGPPNKTMHRSRQPSPFFSLLTSAASPPDRDSPGAGPGTTMHLPVVRDQEELERRVRSAFGDGVESPDDVVLRARQGRAGTAALSTAMARKGKAAGQRY